MHTNRYFVRACAYADEIAHAHNYFIEERGSWLDVAMATVNNHLQLFRTLPWVMGGVGALLIAKYSGMVSGLVM